MKPTARFSEHGHPLDDATEHLSFRRLKQLVRIEHVLADHDLLGNLRQRGEQLIGPCPVHHGDNPTAFRVHLERGLWRCFTLCGGGDIVDLVRKVRSCSYRDAAEYLAALTGRRLPPALPVCAAHPTPPPAADSFRAFRRQLRLDPRSSFLQQHKRIAVETARRFEAGMAPAQSVLHGTVAVRLHDALGRALGYCARRLDPKDHARLGKWWFPRGFPKASVLYNAHRAGAFRAQGIVVVECPWAVMRLAQAGAHGAVALLGTALGPTHIAWLRQAAWVLALMDGDQAGTTAGAAIVSALIADTPVHAVELPAGHEPEDLSDGELRVLVATAASFFLNPSCFAPRGQGVVR